jgi:hypothetical protein
MPTSLPVPSKGALRALRHLALGASCTVAVSAGLLTEDRRRCINTAREVHSNAKKLRSARQYHNAGGATIETLEEQALKYRDDAFWLPSNVLRNTEATSHYGGRAFDKLSQDNSITDDVKPPGSSSPQSMPMAKLPTIKPTIKRAFGIPSQASPADGLSKRTNPVIPAEQISPNDVKVEQYLLATMAASLEFFKNFDLQSDPVDRPLSQESVDIAICLQDTCRKQGRLDLCDQIFDTALSQGRMSEGQFFLFDPEDIMSRLIYHSDGRTSSPDPAKVKKAASIFLTKFTDQPGIMSESMFALGSKICSEALHLQLNELVLKLFLRMENSRGEKPPLCTRYLITATHRKGLHKNVVRYFQKFYKHTSPRQQEFFDICGMVVDSALELQQLDLAEQVLLTASHMAEKEKLFVLNSCVLRVLTHDWRLHRNIVRTRALFSRLETVISMLQYPQEVYARIIRYCVEARDEEATHFYYDQVQQIYDHVAYNSQIHGHFALAKAYRKDWNGVFEEFSKAYKAHLGNQEDLSRPFLPILQEYAKSHSLTEVEAYINLFASRFGLKINQYMMNFMVSIYAQAKEIDSMVRWIDCAIDDGCAVDSHTMNTILKKCYYLWKFSYEQVLQLFFLIRDKSGTSTKLHNPDTMVLLRRIALRTRKVPTKMHRLKRYDKHSTDREGVYRSMATTYAKEDFFATLKIYKRAQKQQPPLDQMHLLLAVRASLKYHEDNVDEATRFIKEAQQRHLRIRAAISIVFVHQITKLSDEGVPFTRLVEVCHNTITAFENAGIEVPAAVVTHTSSCLHRRGFYGQAVDIWNSMCSRLKISPSSLDLASLTSLLNAYIGLQDPAGVRWVLHMLSVNQLSPDKHVKSLMNDARRMTTHMIKSQPCSDQVHDFLDSILEGLEKIKGMRAAALEEQIEVRIKTIKIIEKAIHDEKTKAGVFLQDDSEPQKMRKTGKTAANSTHEIEAGVRISGGSKNIHDVDLTST